MIPVVMLITGAIFNEVAATVVVVAVAEAVAVESTATVDSVYVTDVTVGIASITADVIPTFSTSIQEQFDKSRQSFLLLRAHT